MNRDDAFAAELPLLDQELEDRQAARRLTAIAAALIVGGSEAMAGARALFRELHERDHQGLTEMADRLQAERLRRAEPTTPH